MRTPPLTAVRRTWEDRTLTITIPIIVQDPRKTPNPVNVTVRGPLLAGPIGERMAVFDYNVDRDVVFPPATPRKDGSFPEYELDDMRFHQLNAYAIAARATELVELELGRRPTRGATCLVGSRRRGRYLLGLLRRICRSLTQWI